MFGGMEISVEGHYKLLYVCGRWLIAPESAQTATCPDCGRSGEIVWNAEMLATSETARVCTARMCGAACAGCPWNLANGKKE